MKIPLPPARVLVPTLITIAALVVVARQQVRISRLERDLEMARASIGNLSRHAAETAVGAADPNEIPMTLAELASALGQGGTGEATGGDSFAQLGTLLEDPATREMIRGRILGVVREEFGGLLGDLGIGEPEQSRILDVLVQRQLAQLEATASMAAPDQSEEARSEARRRAEEIAATFDRQIREEAGDEAYATIALHLNATAERRELGAFREALSTAGVPLAFATQTALLELMVAARQSPEFAERFAGLPDPLRARLSRGEIDRLLADYEALHARVSESARAAGLLTPVQQQVFEQNQAAFRDAVRQALDRPENATTGDGSP